MQFLSQGYHSTEVTTILLNSPSLIKSVPRPSSLSQCYARRQGDGAFSFFSSLGFQNHFFSGARSFFFAFYDGFDVTYFGAISPAPLITRRRFD